MIHEDFNGNLIDNYWLKNNSLFQIDANMGAVGYIMVSYKQDQANPIECGRSFTYTSNFRRSARDKFAASYPRRVGYGFCSVRQGERRYICGHVLGEPNFD
jgi:hypothetical protein